MEVLNLVREDGSQRFGSLFQRCSCGSIQLKMWLQVPEFIAKLELMIDQGIELCDETLLPVMKEIYDQKLKEKQQANRNGAWYDGFEFGEAKSGMRRMRKAIEAKQNPPANAV